MEVMLSLLKELNNKTVVLNGAGVICEIKDDTTLLSQLKSECDEQLIARDGQLRQEVVLQLARHGYQHRIFESDSFGPMTCGISTRQGWLIY